ncbi:MAG: hypothetical protein AAF850_06830 [Pseudomonadota bacterium]
MAEQENLSTLSVHEMQERARSAFAQGFRPGPRRLSRAAQLHLIDILSRNGLAGLGLIAGVVIFVAVAGGQTAPFPTAVWAAQVLIALFVCRRLRSDFRVGENLTARPFRWRANYTSALCVLSAAIGAGALMTTTQSDPPAQIMQTCAILSVGLIGSSALHIAHARAATGMLAPGAFFVIACLWQTLGVSIALMTAIGAYAVVLFAITTASRALKSDTAQRFPRTTTNRRLQRKVATALDAAMPRAASQA